MLLSVLASMALTLPLLTSASPVEPRQASHPDRFYLQTQVYPGIDDCGTNKSALRVFSYHTGAGLGKAAADPPTPDDTDSWFYLNDTDTGLYFTYTNNTGGPWPTTLEYGPYQGFNPISISVANGPATTGFFFNETGLQSNQSANGWLACDWWYEDPQIFAYNGFQYGPLPTSCSRVNLIAVAAA